MRDFGLFGRSRFLGGRRPRSAAIVVVLVLSLVVAGTLAYQAQQASRSHRETAQNVLRDYATFASWELSRVARGALYDALGSQLTGLASRCDGRDILPDPQKWARRKDG